MRVVWLLVPAAIVRPCGLSMKVLGFRRLLPVLAPGWVVDTRPLLQVSSEPGAMYVLYLIVHLLQFWSLAAVHFALLLHLHFMA